MTIMNESATTPYTVTAISPIEHVPGRA